MNLYFPNQCKKSGRICVANRTGNMFFVRCLFLQVMKNSPQPYLNVFPQNLELFVFKVCCEEWIFYIKWRLPIQNYIYNHPSLACKNELHNMELRTWNKKIEFQIYQADMLTSKCSLAHIYKNRLHFEVNISAW